jgi:phosphoenolpyruvate carboxylase
MNLISAPADISSKDLPLREDVRLLGRILGDILRDQEGEESYQLIDSVRRAAVRFRNTQDERDGETLEQMLDALPPTDALAVVRAFSYFSQLANIAEDLHHNRRHRAGLKAGSPPEDGSLLQALKRLQDKKIGNQQLQPFLDSALVSPVLTAHPTEVQRKSILDCQLVISGLLSDRHRMDMTPEELAENEEALHRFMLILWQTRMLRTAKLRVRDEIVNGLEFYRYTFLDEIPKIYAGLEKELRQRFDKTIQVPPLLRVGSWIGGDRDGNPFVTHDVMRDAVQQHSALAFEHYLGEAFILGRRLSLTDRLVDVSDALRKLSDSSPDKAPERSDEP